MLLVQFSKFDILCYCRAFMLSSQDGWMWCCWVLSLKAIITKATTTTTRKLKQCICFDSLLGGLTDWQKQGAQTGTCLSAVRKEQNLNYVENCTFRKCVCVCVCAKKCCCAQQNCMCVVIVTSTCLL